MSRTQFSSSLGPYPHHPTVSGAYQGSYTVANAFHQAADSAAHRPADSAAHCHADRAADGAAHCHAHTSPNAATAAGPIAAPADCRVPACGADGESAAFQVL